MKKTTETTKSADDLISRRSSGETANTLASLPEPISLDDDNLDRRLIFRELKRISPPQVWQALKPLKRQEFGAFSRIHAIYQSFCTPKPRTVENAFFGNMSPGALIKLLDCLDYVLEHGKSIEGIYRVSSSQDKLVRLAALLNSSYAIPSTPVYRPADVAALIKQYFQALPFAAIPDSLARALLAVMRMPYIYSFIIFRR